MTGGKRTREDNSGVQKGGKRVTRSTSQAQHAEAGPAEVNETQRLDTAASPAQPAHNTLSAPSLIPPRPRRDQAILTKLSAAKAIKHLDAQAKARFLHEIQVDDELAEVAYQRNLLATFVITPPSVASGSSPPFQVEAPEFASVEYLKRRITKAKLLLYDELYVYDRLALREAYFPGREQDGELKVLDEKMPSTNIPMLLFNLGYRGGETYHVSMISRANTTDKIQQQNMLQAAAAAGAPRVVALSDPAARVYQELLHGSPVAAQAQAPVIRSTQIATEPIPSQIDASPRPRAMGGNAAAAAGGPAPLPSPTEDDNQVGAALNMIHIARADRQPRAGRWSAGEIEALVGGVMKFQFNWADIKKQFGGNQIDERRTPVDYKDKWRNLVKVCRDPSKLTRSVGISDELKVIILEIAGPVDQHTTS